jgi:hypothetical protein
MGSGWTTANGLGFTVTSGKISTIDLFADQERLGRIDLQILQ